MTDERDDGNFEAAVEPVPEHPKNELITVADVAAMWHSEGSSPKLNIGTIEAELLDLATDEQAEAGLTFHDMNGKPQNIFKAMFDHYAEKKGSYAAAKALVLSRSALRQFVQTPEGQAWCESWGLPSRPVFLFGEPELVEDSSILPGSPTDKTEGSLEALHGLGPRHVPEGYISILDGVEQLHRRLFVGFNLEAANPNSVVFIELNKVPGDGDARRDWKRSYCEDKMLNSLQVDDLIALQQPGDRDTRTAIVRHQNIWDI